MRRYLLALVLLSAGWARAGVVLGQYQTATGGLVNNATLTFTLSQGAIAPGQAGIVSQYTNCYTSNSGQVVGVPDLIIVPTISANTSSGSLPGGTYYVKISYLDFAGGEGAPSPERKVLLTGPGALIISAPVAISNASGYAVYISTASGTETLQGQTAGWGNYTQSAPLVVGSLPVAANTSLCSLRFSDELIPTGTYYTVQMLNAKGTRVAGFPQTWCTYGGAGGTIDISRGVPTGSCATNGVYYPTPILATPLAGAGATQTINGPLDLSGYALINPTLANPILANPTLTGTVDLSAATVTGADFTRTYTCAGNNPCSNTLLGPGIALISGGGYQLSGGAYTLNGLPFASNSSYQCFAWDLTNSANKVLATLTSGAAASFAGTSSDFFGFICMGH